MTIPAATGTGAASAQVLVPHQRSLRTRRSPVSPAHLEHDGEISVGALRLSALAAA